MLERFLFVTFTSLYFYSVESQAAGAFFSSKFSNFFTTPLFEQQYRQSNPALDENDFSDLYMPCLEKNINENEYEGINDLLYDAHEKIETGLKTQNKKLYSLGIASLRKALQYDPRQGTISSDNPRSLVFLAKHDTAACRFACIGALISTQAISNNEVASLLGEIFPLMPKATPNSVQLREYDNPSSP